MEAVIEFLMNSYKSGGYMMNFISLAMVSALAIGIERAYMLFMKLYVDGAGLMANVEKLVSSDKMPQAIKFCEYHGTAALARIFRAGLNVADENEEVIQTAVDETTLQVLPQIQKRTAYLQMIANVSTLLGLLGTIIGIIAAFAGLAAADPVTRQELLGRGISEALNATAYGLLVAIPSMVMHSILMARTVTLVDEIDFYSSRLVNLLVGPKKKGK